MYEHNAFGYSWSLALCLTKLRSSRARCPATALIFDRIFFSLAGKEDNHKILDEFDIRPDLTSVCRVSCP